MLPTRSSGILPVAKHDRALAETGSFQKDRQPSIALNLRQLGFVADESFGVPGLDPEFKLHDWQLEKAMRSYLKTVLSCFLEKTSTGRSYVLQGSQALAHHLLSKFTPEEIHQEEKHQNIENSFRIPIDDRSRADFDFSIRSVNNEANAIKNMFMEVIGREFGQKYAVILSDEVPVNKVVKVSDGYGTHQKILNLGRVQSVTVMCGKSILLKIDVSSPLSNIKSYQERITFLNSFYAKKSALYESKIADFPGVVRMSTFQQVVADLNFAISNTPEIEIMENKFVLRRNVLVSLLTLYPEKVYVRGMELSDNPVRFLCEYSYDHLNRCVNNLAEGAAVARKEGRQIEFIAHKSVQVFQESEDVAVQTVFMVNENNEVQSKKVELRDSSAQVAMSVEYTVNLPAQFRKEMKSVFVQTEREKMPEAIKTCTILRDVGVHMSPCFVMMVQEDTDSSDQFYSANEETTELYEKEPVELASNKAGGEHSVGSKDPVAVKMSTHVKRKNKTKPETKENLSRCREAEKRKKNFGQESLASIDPLIFGEYVYGQHKKFLGYLRSKDTRKAIAALSKENMFSLCWEQGVPPVFQLIAESLVNKVAYVKSLANKGWDINRMVEIQSSQTIYRVSSLGYAVLDGNRVKSKVSDYRVKMIRILLSEGANPDQIVVQGKYVDGGSKVVEYIATPLMLAVKKQWSKCVDILLEYDADTNIPIKKLGSTQSVLVSAVSGAHIFYEGSLRIINSLIARHVNLDAVSIDVDSVSLKETHFTALITAISCGFVSIMTLLLEAGCDPNIPRVVLEFEDKVASDDVKSGSSDLKASEEELDGKMSSLRVSDRNSTYNENTSEKVYPLLLICESMDSELLEKFLNASVKYPVNVNAENIVEPVFIDETRVTVLTALHCVAVWHVHKCKEVIKADESVQENITEIENNTKRMIGLLKKYGYDFSAATNGSEYTAQQVYKVLLNKITAAASRSLNPDLFSIID